MHVENALDDFQPYILTHLTRCRRNITQIDPFTHKCFEVATTMSNIMKKIWKFNRHARKPRTKKDKPTFFTRC